MSGRKWRVRCLICRWRGVRTATECECYDEYALYCRPGAPGPGCPSGVVWPCPHCGRQEAGAKGPNGGFFSNGSSVVGVAPVKHRTAP
jgi:hypothetical protein